MKQIRVYTTLLCAAMLSGNLRAEEGGVGHYTPGATASFIDVLPDTPGFAYMNQFLYYNGTYSGRKGLPLGARLAANIDATSFADVNVLLYKSSFEILWGKYAAAIAIPYVWMDIDAEGTLTGPRGRVLKKGVSDRDEGLGDIFVAPFMLGWKSGDIMYATQFGFYAPTGGYDKDNLANVGLNYWTFEPGVSMSYLGSKNGIEVTTFLGYDINTKNQDIDYRTGDQAHLDLTVAQHLPLGKGFVGAGVNGFYYQQITGDSGDGAKMGDFKGKTVGVGPVLSYAITVGTYDMALEVKWLPELDVENRLKGDFVWAKAVIKF